MPLTLATEQTNWAKKGLSAASGAFVNDASSFAYGASAPTENLANGLFVFVVPNVGGGSNPATNCTLFLSFYAKVATSSPAFGVNIRVWGLSDLAGGGYYGRYFLQAEASVGITPGNDDSGSSFPSDNRFCDAVRWSTDRSLTPPAVRAIGSNPFPSSTGVWGGRGWATLAIDSMGYRPIVAELRRTDTFSGNQVSLCWRVG